MLASTADLNCGFARDLFIKWADSADNSVIFTTLTPPGTLARKLIDNPNLESIDLEVSSDFDLLLLSCDHLKTQQAMSSFRNLLVGISKAGFPLGDIFRAQRSGYCL